MPPPDLINRRALPWLAAIPVLVLVAIVGLTAKPPTNAAVTTPSPTAPAVKSCTGPEGSCPANANEHDRRLQLRGGH